jgi:hypothetical protein
MTMYQVNPARHLRFETLVERSELAVPGPFVAGAVEASASALIDDLTAASDLSVAGVLVARSMILHALQTQRRLRRAQPFIERAEQAVAAEPVPGPIVISGAPRSGTTLLQHLISGTSPVRNLTYWQAFHPTAQLEARYGLAEFAVPRAIADAECRVDELRMVEEVFARRPVDPYGVAECTPMLTSALDSFEILTMFDVPAFRERMLTRSHDAEMSIVALQLAAIDGPRLQPWLLKSLSFPLDYDAVVTALGPRALVHVRRPAAEAFASFVELAIAARSHTSGQVSTSAVAREMLDLWCRVLTRAADALSKASVPVMTVEYRELVGNPRAAISALRAQLPELGNDPLSEARLEAIARDQRRAHMPSSQFVEDFGLTTDDVTRRLHDASCGYFFS